MNTKIYAEEWAVTLQDRLSEDTLWKELGRVIYTNTKTLHNPYGDDATVQDLTRGIAYTHQAIVEHDDSVSIDTGKILPQLVDRADLAQSTYDRQMELAESQGTLLDEAIETLFLASHAQLTNFGDTGGGVLGLSATPITISQTNIDDVIRGIKREIRKAKGTRLLKRNGAFIVWRPEDFEILEAFAQANGFSVADYALKNGTDQGFFFMGVYHYSSVFYATGHVIAGIKNLLTVGVCTATYGQVILDSEPATSTGAISGIAVVSRVDVKVKAWAKTIPVLFDVNVN